MKLKLGNFLEAKPQENLVLVPTGNGVVIHKKNLPERLVMGAGSAKEILKLHPSLPYWAAESLNLGTYYHNAYWHYGYLPVLDPVGLMSGIGIFQTKLDYRDKSQIGMIIFSVKQLISFQNKFPEYEFQIPFPGIGLGGLSVENVLPFLLNLNNKVTFFILEKDTFEKANSLLATSFRERLGFSPYVRESSYEYK